MGAPDTARELRRQNFGGANVASLVAPQKGFIWNFTEPEVTEYHN